MPVAQEIKFEGVEFSEAFEDKHQETRVREHFLRELYRRDYISEKEFLAGMTPLVMDDEFKKNYRICADLIRRDDKEGLVSFLGRDNRFEAAIAVFFMNKSFEI